MKKIIVVTIIALVAFASCSKKPDTGGTAAEAMANEWWVTISEEGGPDLIPHQHIATYNTAANNNEIWVDDQGHVWDFKIKANADFNARTFNANEAVSVVPGYDIKVTITEGKMIPGVGRSKTGNVTDSIFMKIEFEDDPGTIYEIKGHARTRFSEDEY
jgi:hypothetical protein